MFYCQPCRMQVDSMNDHREAYHPEPPYDDGRTYTLREAAVELRRQECRVQGHSWDVISTFSGPTGIVCGNCGTAHRIAIVENEPATT